MAGISRRNLVLSGKKRCHITTLVKGGFIFVDPTLWLLPVVGAVIGWITNIIAIRMLFRPKRPVRIPLTSFTLQGVVPRRHADLAASIGRTVSRELLPVAELLGRVDVSGIKAQMVEAVTDHVDRKLETGLPRILPQGMRLGLAAYLRDVISREADEVLESLLADFGGRISDHIDVEALVTEKVMALDLDQLEELIIRIAGREVSAVVLFGGVLGFVIGLLQMLIVAVLQTAR